MIDSNHLVVLVDASSYLFRAYHGLPALSNRDGHPTHAIHGVIKMLTKLYDDHQPAYFGVIFDAKGKTFRHTLYPEYKANRPPAPTDLVKQIQPLQDLITALGYPLLIESGVEADDVIGTLSQRALEEGYQVIIATGDKDMTQLLTHPNITLLDTMKNSATTAENIAERFKVEQLEASQVADFLALIGDTADNIPGIPKVGAKTAAKWLAEYQTLDNLIDNASKIKGKIGESLRAHLAQLPLSRELATINMALPLTTSIADLALLPPNPDKIALLCDTYELNYLKQRLCATAPAAAPLPITQHYHLVKDAAQLNALIDTLKQQSSFSFDTETTSLNYMHAELVGISVSTCEGEAHYLPLAHQLGENLEFNATLLALKPLLEDPKYCKIGHHLKYDRHILSRYNIELKGILEDTMLMSYSHHATASRHNLDDLAHHYLNYRTTRFEEIAGKGSKQLSFNQIALDIACDYACEDADITQRLYQLFSKRLAENPSLYALYAQIERPLADVLYRMEAHGVKIDKTRLTQQSQELSQTLDALEQQAHELAGEVFNLSSPKQLRDILYQKLALTPPLKTPTGQASTNEEALQQLADAHELPAIILRHRELTKLKTTYTDKLPELIHPSTQRIHTSYHQAITSTGRLSSSEPNLQNIPIRSEEGRRIRQAFIAQTGYVLLAADYSQIELRLMAHLSADEKLLQAFEQEQDIHAATAAEIFSILPEQVERHHRRHAKAINFGLMYGMSAFGLARQLHISRQQAAEYIERYFSRYPKVGEYIDSSRESARQLGYVETLLGRRLYLPDIKSKNPQRRNAAERLAINAPMQGSAADIIKLAMIDIDKAHRDNPECRLIMQVHDELVFEVAQDKAEALKADIKARMENAYRLKVPLIVEANLGKNWDEAH